MVYLYVALGNKELGDILNPVLLVIGALFPDSDHKHAPMGRFVPLWLICKHRGFTHSIQGLAIFTGLVGVFSVGWGFSFGIGYLSHLLLDSLTPSGVKWWWTNKKTIRRWSSRV